MKLKERILSVALVLLPVSLIGMAFSYFMGRYHAMFFWGVLVGISFIVFCALQNPHNSGKRKSCQHR
ncbi:hypothetical protein SAMN05216354_0606 [Xylanibacter ruminicola]|uniref:Uncharacterized protein n=1 Tax=Xylanibacter ruminicola TaxID=839 RepID=A0A1H5SD47_XYLRU|nr:hypothetical protein [Xylanibacter ruminicola]SEF47908.1 hypothetical protein SAMN05216354_0606 [Xylanibacter ruminicola]